MLFRSRRLLDAAVGELVEIVAELRAREIVPPTDHHDAEVAELKRRLGAV